jgi:hypothetical protein
VNCDVIKLVEVLFIDQVNGSNRTVGKQPSTLRHIILTVFSQVRFCLSLYINVTLCVENLVRTSFRYSDNSRYKILMK